MTTENETPTVNDLISSLRRSQITPEQSAGAGTVMAPSLPPQIQRILSLPETPPPRSRGREARRLFDENGRPRPAGPAPPKSWLKKAKVTRAGAGDSRQGRLYPETINHLPEISSQFETRIKSTGNKSRSLMNVCLRRMAMDWDFIAEWERNNLSSIRTRLRMDLLSNIAVLGLDYGIGYENLKALLIPPEAAGFQDLPDNDGFYRLDLSGSMGRSVSFKQLTELVETHRELAEEAEDSWEVTVSRSLGPTITHLTHLSLSYPPQDISWPRFLQFAKHVPALTHLSLAHWPVPCMTPNSQNAIVTSPFGKTYQAGGTNFYSHTLDNDYREAASIMRRLATILYGLEYIDLTGCTDWAPALRWKGDGEMGIDWSSQWVKLTTLKLYSDIKLSEQSNEAQFNRYVEGLRNSIGLEFMMFNGERKRDGKAKSWLEVHHDDHREYSQLWRGPGEDNKRKRSMLDKFNTDDWTWTSGKMASGTHHPRIGELLEYDVDILRRSIWEQ